MPCDSAEAMIKNRIPSSRKTVTLAESLWAAVEKYRQEHEILTVTDTISRLLKAGLQVKVAVVGRNAKRDAL